ncbi:aldehyde dehydrogenase family protein [Kocuria sp. KSNUG]|uniref:aldehyde dehydrogenase family protein n=1 Tax=Kocuria sp. KSNUG TaxID=3136676 RepID=UPI003C2C06CB
MSAATVTLNHLIDGRWVPGEGDVFTSGNPARPDETVAEGARATPEQVTAAMAAAHSALSQWSVGTPMASRGVVLAKAAALLRERAQQHGEELAREEGKTLAEGVGEVTRAAQILDYFADEGERCAGEVFHSPRGGERILVTRKPLGVVGVITPFNFPIAIPAWKIAPALVYGNTVVWKPASAVPLLAVRLAQALHDAGLPHGVLNLVMGSGSLGDTLLEDPRLDGLTFTGSTAVGRALCGRAAERGIPVQADMGGKNASVVLADADVELATEQVLFGAFRSTGQKCTATSRLIVEEPVAERVLDRLRERLEQWTVGDPTDPSVHMGPLVSAAAAQDVRDGVDAALSTGAWETYRGTSPEGDAFVPATIVEVPADDAGLGNDAWREEFFGPVLTVVRARDAAHAFELANDSEFGLSCALFTDSTERILEAMDVIDVGILHVNSESAGADPHVPFGGAKKSGYGPKEQGAAAKEFFTHTTTVYLRGAQT